MASTPDMTPEDLNVAFTQAAGQTAATPTPEPTAPVAEPVQAAEPTEQELSAAFRAAQAAGFDVSQFGSDEELVQAMYEQVNRAKPYVEYAQSVLPYDKDLRELIQKRSAPPQETAQPAPAEEWKPETHFRKAWGAPDYDKGWEAFIQSGMITIDQDTGQFVAAPKYGNAVPINVLQGLNSRRQWQRQALEKLLDNPYEETWKAFQEPLERYIQERLDGHLRQRDSLQAINAWERQNEKNLYEHDAKGELQYDVYGNPKASRYGEVFIAAAKDARQRFNGASQEDVIRYASAIAAPYLAQQQAPAAPVVEPQVEQAAPEDEEPFLRKALKRAAHSPNSGGYSEANDLEPVALDQRELDDMFKVASRKLGLK